MSPLQIREKEIFETLNALNNCKFVLIGGYAVNAYTLPRFSVDCDIVVKDHAELERIQDILKEIGYVEKETKWRKAVHAEFIPYQKVLDNEFKTSVDILFHEILDRQTGATISAKWVFDNSSERILKGKTILEGINLRIINADALIVMKSISCRNTDVRDVFMLADKADNGEWIKREISRRTDLKVRFSRIRQIVESADFRNNLQGVYGYVEPKAFDRNKQAMLKLLAPL